MPRRVFVVGNGMTKFEKPGVRDDDYPDMAAEAIKQALDDARISPKEVQQATVGYVFGDTTCGQRAIYESLEFSGVGIINVNNACATGSSALYIAKQFVAGGVFDCVLAVGFEKMERGALGGSKYPDRTIPMDRHMGVMMELRGYAKAPPMPQIFGNAGREYMEKYNVKPEIFGKIAQKNHKHSVHNERAQFRNEHTLEEVMNSKKIYDPLTVLQCSPPSDGAAAAIVVSEDFVKKHNLQANAVEILGMTLTTDLPTTFDDEKKSVMNAVGYDICKKGAQDTYKEAGVTPNDIQVIELHDCFSCNELITYEGLGLCEPGKAAEIVEKGDNTYGGKWVINPSGGLISKGHPLGATGLAQCAELCWQLRGMCGKRQVQGAKIGLQHNLGLGSACVIGIYKKAFGSNL